MINSSDRFLTQTATPVAEDMTTCIESMRAEAQRAVTLKGEAARSALMTSYRDQDAFDAAYAEWKQAQTTLAAINAELNARRADAAVPDAA
jgi:hypothetical protein